MTGDTQQASVPLDERNKKLVKTLNSPNIHVLNLRVGELVEVRSPREILSTLDQDGRLDALPFMPEMVPFCGRRFRVFKRVDKTCDTIDKTGMRRMENTVILDDVRCSGQAHGGCQAACMIFWKEAWLRRVPEPGRNGHGLIRIDRQPSLESVVEADRAELEKTLEKNTFVESELYEDRRYICQITELKKATTTLAAWDLSQYWRDIRSRNVTLWRGIRGLLIMLFNWVQALRGGCPYPYMPESNRTATPRGALNLVPGELVRVKAPEDIFPTLDHNHKNRGLWFDREMLQYCGGTYRVRGRVQQLIHERTGKMIKLSNDCIILEDVICRGECHQFCPRSEFIYWREIWLERAPTD